MRHDMQALFEKAKTRMLQLNLPLTIKRKLNLPFHKPASGFCCLSEADLGEAARYPGFFMQSREQQMDWLIQMVERLEADEESLPEQVRFEYDNRQKKSGMGLGLAEQGILWLGAESYELKDFVVHRSSKSSSKRSFLAITELCAKGIQIHVRVRQDFQAVLSALRKHWIQNEVFGMKLQLRRRKIYLDSSMCQPSMELVGKTELKSDKKKDSVENIFLENQTGTRPLQRVDTTKIFHRVFSDLSLDSFRRDSNFKVLESGSLK